jgi:hypothetical protein
LFAYNLSDDKIHLLNFQNIVVELIDNFLDFFLGIVIEFDLDFDILFGKNQFDLEKIDFVLFHIR